MKIVYVAGPFRAPTSWGIAENIRAAEAKRPCAGPSKAGLLAERCKP